MKRVELLDFLLCQKNIFSNEWWNFRSGEKRAGQRLLLLTKLGTTDRPGTEGVKGPLLIYQEWGAWNWLLTSLLEGLIRNHTFATRKKKKEGLGCPSRVINGLWDRMLHDNGVKTGWWEWNVGDSSDPSRKRYDGMERAGDCRPTPPDL